MNKLILIGNLTRDPELRTTPTGISVCDFTVAVNSRGKKDENDAQYFRVTVWRTLGENCAKYLSKGRKVFVSGPVTARTYQAQNGETRVSLEVTAEDVEFLSARTEGTEAPASQSAPPAVPAGCIQVNPDEIPF